MAKKQTRPTGLSAKHVREKWRQPFGVTVIQKAPNKRPARNDATRPSTRRTDGE